MHKIFIRLPLFFLLLSMLYPQVRASNEIKEVFFYKSLVEKADVIEDFDDGTVSLYSYPGQDLNSSSWELSSTVTYENSPYSLRLFGNTWKQQTIQSVSVKQGDVWQVSSYIQSLSEIQGFGLSDGTNVLFYSFAGTEEISDSEWITVYQGCFPEDQWNEYQLPLADDWLALYGYLPEISSIIYVNDNDGGSPGVVYFDFIIDISSDLPVIPEVSIDYTKGKIYTGGGGKRYLTIQFNSVVYDPDSEEHTYYWNFGDGSTSAEENPEHTFLVEDDHNYTVILQVVDPTGRWGRASCTVEVDPGSSSFPVTLNFVGDIMLARNFEYPGGIIPTQGVESIFEPTKPWLGDAADITIANLECPFTTYWQNHPTKTVYFKSSPDNVSGLSYAGIDIVSLANNHIYDYLYPGMQETQNVLASNNIIYSGAGANSYEAYLPAFYTKSGVNFAFLAASDRTGQYNNFQPYLNAGFNKPGFANLTEYSLTQQINEVKDIADLVVMEWHCGYEYSTEPHKTDFDDYYINKKINESEDYSPLKISPDKQNREIRQFAIDQGADIVICHHPHIIHGVELYKGKLIAHSLGNFVFDLYYPETFPSMILNTKVNETGFYEFSITPVYIDDYIPLRAEGELGLHILDYLAERSKELDTYLNVDRENIIALVITDTLNMQIDEHQYTAQLSFEQLSGNWFSAPFALERTGSISSVDEISPAGNYKFRLGRELIWFGNMEDEGCTLWELNNGNEQYCDTTFFSGIRSLQHKRDENSPYNLVTELENKIICSSDTLNFSLAAYIRTQNAKNVTVYVQYFQNRWDTYPFAQENIGEFINGDTPWTLYHKKLNIPNGTQFFNLSLNSNIPDEGTAYAWFDDISLISWDKWDRYKIGDNIPFPNDYYFLQVKTDQDPTEVTLQYTETTFNGSQVGIDDPIKEKNALKITVQNYPNPFNPENGPTKLSIRLANEGNIKVTVNNIFGQTVKIIKDQSFPPGNHILSWDGRDQNGKVVSPGLYFFQINASGLKQVKKCIVINN